MIEPRIGRGPVPQGAGAPPVPLPKANGRATATQITVDRHELVGSLMDMQALAAEGMTAVGEALRAIERLYEALQGTSPRIKAIEHAVVAIHDRQTRLLNEATMLAGRYDGVQTNGHRPT